MAIDPAYRGELEVKLAPVCRLRTRAMFGGLGIYDDDTFFALADDGKLYLKVDDSNRADYEARGMQAFVPWEGAQPMGYWELPPGVVDDEAELKVWVDKAIAVAERAKKPKRRKKA